MSNSAFVLVMIDANDLFECDIDVVCLCDRVELDVEVSFDDDCDIGKLEDFESVFIVDNFDGFSFE